MALPAHDPHPKTSRYRSTRQKQFDTQTPLTAGVPPSSFNRPSTNDSIQRSRSRYRRAQPNGHSSHEVPVPIVPTQAVSTNTAITAPALDTPDIAPGVADALTGPTHHLPISSSRYGNQAGGNAQLPDRARTSHGGVQSNHHVSLEERTMEEAKRLGEAEQGRHRKLRERVDNQKETDLLRRQPHERERTPRFENAQYHTIDVAQQRQKFPQGTYQRDAVSDTIDRNGRTTSREASQPFVQTEATLRQSSSREFLGLFKRKRGDPAGKAGTPPAVVTPFTSESYQAAFKDTATATQVTHGVDVPISAVNAGDRQVLVEASGASIYLTVTPSTTPVDLIGSASSRLNHRIEPRSSVLMENFGKVGVQRPLRKYEHVRDIMNSWDDDRQNSLILVPSATGGQDPELEVKYVPVAQPEEFACQLSYSQKPGKWDKRWVTLRQDGQVTVAKKQGVKPTDQINVCHLSDFDIYTPAPKQSYRKIKAPKKHCFAIKSQQKSNIFASMQSFVHFFCSNDKRAAAAFYRAVQSWRSWYLVNVLGQDSTKRAEPTTRTGTGVADVTTNIGAGHGRVASNESQYQAGSFKPPISLNGVNAPNHTNVDLSSTANRPRSRSNSSSHGQGFGLNTARARTSGGARAAGPPSAFPSNFSTGVIDHARQHSGSNPTSPADGGTFAPTGLLGRSYSKRQADAVARENERNNGTVTDGIALVKTTSRGLEPPSRSSLDRFNSQSEPNLKRSSSQRRPQKPLVDLTPQFREPPQHAKKGKGYHPDAIGPGGLVESATSPDEAIHLPPSTDWRARQYQRTGTMGGAQRPNTAAASNNPAPDFDRTISLARNKSVRNKAVGGGGTRVEEVWEQNAQGMGFQAGSLLDKVQKEGREHFSEGPAGMRWDRSKGEEKVVAYGEAA